MYKLSQSTNILEALGIDVWQLSTALKDKYPLDDNDKKRLIHVILAKNEDQNCINPMLNALFFASEKKIYSQISTLAQINVASSDIVLYDNRLSYEINHDKSYAIPVSELNKAKIKKQVMMDVYAVSDFAIK